MTVAYRSVVGSAAVIACVCLCGREQCVWFAVCVAVCAIGLQSRVRFDCADPTDLKVVSGLIWRYAGIAGVSRVDCSSSSVWWQQRIDSDDWYT